MSFPFRRVVVDHAIYGETRVWWDLDPSFSDPLLHDYQLQTSQAGVPSATDWQDTGDPVSHCFAAVVDKPDTGKILYQHYRVVLTTSRGTYVSEASPVWGVLTETDWLLAREIRRRELVRLDFLAGKPGFLLKRRRFGERCPRCLDLATKEITDSFCPECHGTGFRYGYFAAVPCCWDVSPRGLLEQRSGTQPPGQKQQTTVTARISDGLPVTLLDIWVNSLSDERWAVGGVQHTVELRGVPLIVSCELHLLPFTDQVYRVPVNLLAADLAVLPVTQELSKSGTGSQRVTHNYGSPDALVYRHGPDASCGIGGARVRAFPAGAYAAGERELFTASTETTADGRWAGVLQLDPGNYILEFSKLGAFGPDTIAITVTTAIPLAELPISPVFTSPLPPPPPAPSLVFGSGSRLTGVF